MKFLINYNSLRCQAFYNRGGGGLGFSCLMQVFVHVSRKPFFFTHHVDQFFLYIHEAKTIFKYFFYKSFTSKFKQIFIKRRLLELKLYKKR